VVSKPDQDNVTLRLADCRLAQARRAGPYREERNPRDLAKKPLNQKHLVRIDFLPVLLRYLDRLPGPGKSFAETDHGAEIR
jgi:hypothetical protein